ncbi:unnamed protein product, partial [Discosporangium mesarthrocarpum]
KLIKLTEVACGVGNVLQNKGAIGAFLRVDRTTMLFVTAHLAAHQSKVEERNANYWRVVASLEEEIPPAWITHASRKREKRLKAEGEEQLSVSTEEQETIQGPGPGPGPGGSGSRGWVGGGGGEADSRGPFGDRVDRVFFFGDLNYRVDLTREDLELGVMS